MRRHLTLGFAIVAITLAGVASADTVATPHAPDEVSPDDADESDDTGDEEEIEVEDEPDPASEDEDSDGASKPSQRRSK